MRVFIRLLAVVGVLSFVFTLASAVSDPEPGDKEKGEKFEPDEKKELKSFTRRYLRLRNVTEERVAAFVQYRTFEEDKWVWLPGEPDSGKALSYDLDPGAELVLEVDDQKVTASRARVWASSRSFKWEEHRDADLKLVPEVEDDEHRYKAFERDTFTHTFAAPGGEALEKQPMPEPGQVIDVQMNENIEGGVMCPTVPDLPPPPLDITIEPPPVDPIPLPDYIPLPVLPAPLKADLAVTGFKLDGAGAFVGKLENLGPVDYPGGRRWFVLRKRLGKPGYGAVVAQGDVGPLATGDAQLVGGFVPGIVFSARYVLLISPGDPNRKNDFSSILWITPVTGKSDLAVSSLKRIGGKLIGTITNNGPQDCNGDGKRVYQIGDKSGMVAPERGKVPALNKGDSVDVVLDVTAALGVKTTFYLILNNGDDNVANDFADLFYLPKKPGFVPDLEAQNLVIKGNVLQGTIVNNGPGTYFGGRSYYLGNAGASKSLSIPALKTGAVYPVNLPVPKALLASNQTFYLNVSSGDAKPGNDFTKYLHKIKEASDLAADLKLDGDILKGKITNKGPDEYDGLSRTFKLYFGGGVYKQGPVFKKLKVGESFIVPPHKLPAGSPTQTVFLTLNAGDDNPKNDSDSVKYLSASHDLAVNLAIIGTNAKVTITNIGSGDYEGKRTFTLERQGLKDLTGVVPGPIAPKSSKSAFYSLAAMTKGGKVTFKLSPADPNPFNDFDSAKYVPTNHDLAVSLAIAGTSLKVTVTNVGASDYEGKRTFTLERQGLKDMTGVVPGPIAPTASKMLTYSLAAMAKGGKVTYTLSPGDPNPANDSASIKYVPAPKGFDLAVDSVTLAKGAFHITVSNSGPEVYAGGDGYSISGPGGFKESGKIPAVGLAKSVTFAHPLPKGALAAGAYTVTLNVADIDPKKNTGTLKIVAKGFDLDLEGVAIAKGMFAIKVSNKGPDPYAGGDTYSITGPGGFGESGKIPAVGIAKPVIVIHKTKEKMVAGVYTVTLNVKDNDASNNSATVKYVPGKVSLDEDRTVRRLLPDSQRVVPAIQASAYGRSRYH